VFLFSVHLVCVFEWVTSDINYQNNAATNNDPNHGSSAWKWVTGGFLALGLLAAFGAGVAAASSGGFSAAPIGTLSQMLGRIPNLIYELQDVMSRLGYIRVHTAKRSATDSSALDNLNYNQQKATRDGLCTVPQLQGMITNYLVVLQAFQTDLGQWSMNII
jgi:hypothetical protein